MDRYYQERVLATALYGDVLLCHDRHSGARVAIKRMQLAAAADRKTLLDGKDVAEDVLFEAQVNHAIAASGGHAHLLRMQHEFEQDGFLHFVYDYCATGDLLDLLTTDVCFPRATALAYFRDICAAVLHLHRLGFAHRDLSMENILLDDTNGVQVCDFGLACTASAPTSARVGKQFYMAPEVVAGVCYDATKADVWSLGVLFFEMLSGGPLFTQASSATDPRFEFFARDGLVALLEKWGIATQFDDDVVGFLSQMLAIDPATRPAAADLLAHPIFATAPSTSSSSSLEALTTMTSMVSSIATSVVGNYINRLLFTPWRTFDSSTTRH
ncbi:Aste57867_8978 [Aphanomyces stellatus]|uniref:Aste57867_8978 protein n=1 Tax=Aphanomyces stellatus TaxID=120398 RepID=A0A485KLV7_9STRA|nr:hypothetical protein As57867_008943 [Aphanomyces stellatus]VFT85862.1 Aste57867_8978 [Aphanomyces stellatus]